MDKKLAEIAKTEAEEKKKHNLLLQLIQKINELKKKTNETDIQVAAKERELSTLKEEVSGLKVVTELQESQIEFLRSKMKHQSQLLDDETRKLEEIQQRVWNDTKDFIKGAKKYGPLTDSVKNAEEHLSKRKDLKVRQDLEKENLKMEGEICGLKIYKKMQEKHIAHLERLLTEMFKQGRY